MPPDQPHGIFRFGIYEADASSGELRKSGLRVRLQDQPFQVLLVLLQRPGEVVTREELRQRLWPADTFVDFDHGLNTVMNKLREALSDSASNPRFVETLARRGYRFLAPVEHLDAPRSTPSVPGEADAQTPAPAPCSPQLSSPASSVSVLTRVEDVPAVPRQYARIPFLLIQVMYLTFYVVVLARLARVKICWRALSDIVYGRSHC